MAQRWSERISESLAVRLPPDVVEWMDGDIRARLDLSHPGLFTEAIDPERLIDPNSAVVWGGQMLPDTLPVLNSGCGDVISLRFERDGHVREVIRWDHEGGFWRPYGHTLAEAILTDIGTIKATEDTDAASETGVDARPVEDWAVAWVRRTTAPALRWPALHEGDAFSSLQALVDAGICEAAARREWCEVSLTSGLTRLCRKMGGGSYAERLRVPWATFADWLFDTSLIPKTHYERLSKLLKAPTGQIMRQDWDAGVREARRVCAIRPDLGWPYGVLGWAAERKGDLSGAVEQYLTGLRRLGTSCGFMGKVEHCFIVERLRALHDRLPPDAAADPHVMSALAPCTHDVFPSGVRKYWMRQAQEATSRGEHARAYECYYAAGWDDFVTNDMDEVAEGLVRSAKAAGWEALYRIAELHLASLRAIG